MYLNVVRHIRMHNDLMKLSDVVHLSKNSQSVNDTSLQEIQNNPIDLTVYCM